MPASLEDEKEFLRKNAERRKHNLSWNYTIEYRGQVVGGIGVKIDQHRTDCGEIGYFLDETYWGRGIITDAVSLLEYECKHKLKLRRLTIIMDPRNKGSEKVAIKSGYVKEGRLRKVMKNEKTGTFVDAFQYAKILY
jgi:ribosomal-protein-alanine N-acetyltransferase